MQWGGLPTRKKLCSWCLSYPQKILIFQLLVIVCEIEYPVTCLAFTKHCRWPDFRGQKHESFKHFNCCSNVGGVKLGVIQPCLSNERWMSRKTIRSTKFGISWGQYSHRIQSQAFIDWFLKTLSASHLWGVIQNSKWCGQALFFFPTFSSTLFLF